MLTPLILMMILAQTSQGPLTVGEVKAKKAPALAAKLLPPEFSARVIGGAVHRQWLPGHAYRAVFWEVAEPVGPELCRRRFHGVDLSSSPAPASSDESAIVLVAATPTSASGYRPTYPKPASVETCASTTGWLTPSDDRREATLDAVAELTAAMRAAAGTAPSTFAIDCQTEDEAGAACADPRRALSELPLEALFGVSFDTGHYVTRSETRTASGRTIRMTQQVPAPDGSAPTPIFAFGRSDPDGRSWRATLIGKPGERIRIRLRRSTIIYH